MEFEHLYLEILSPLFWNMDTFNLNLKELNVYITLVSIYHSSANFFNYFQNHNARMIFSKMVSNFTVLEGIFETKFQG